MASEVRLIDGNKAEAVLRNIADHLKEAGNTDLYPATYAAADVIKQQRTIDPEDLRPKGHWDIRCESHIDSITREVDENFYLECSECKRIVWDVNQMAAMNGDYRKLIERYPYCHCGCKMEG